MSAKQLISAEIRQNLELGPDHLSGPAKVPLGHLIIRDDCASHAPRRQGLDLIKRRETAPKRRLSARPLNRAADAVTPRSLVR
jgi:hypothetical protein